MRNPGETEEDEREIGETLRKLRQERKELQNQLGLIRAAAAEPVRVRKEDEIRRLLEHFDDILQRAAAGKLGDDQDTARDILESLTGGRIDMHQQGERTNLNGWLQGRFTIKLFDVLIEKLAGVQPAMGGEGVEVVIDFKRPQKTDSDADRAISLWLDGHPSTVITATSGSTEPYISRLLRIGAERRGTTLDELRPQRKTRPVDPSLAPRYQRIADHVKSLWWDELYPIRVIARNLKCSTTMVCAAIGWWYESRGLAVPAFEDWCREVERRIVAAFEDDELGMQEIAERLYRAHGKAMHTVIGVYRRLGKELPQGWNSRAQLRANQATSPETPI